MGAVLTVDMQVRERFECGKNWNGGETEIVLLEELQGKLVSKIVGPALESGTLEKRLVAFQLCQIQTARNIEMLGFRLSVNECPPLSHGIILC